jgi:hypothetical protein
MDDLDVVRFLIRLPLTAYPIAHITPVIYLTGLRSLKQPSMIWGINMKEASGDRSIDPAVI